MTKIINLTPHSINIYREDALIQVIPSSGIARCAVTTEKIGNIENLDIYKNVYGDVSGLPDEERKDTIYIVSMLIAQAVKDLRNDCYIVNDTVRDSQGRIIGCRSLARI